MEQYFGALRNCLLFRGTTDAELSAMLSCLSARIAQYDRGDFIMTEGKASRYVGLVQSTAWLYSWSAVCRFTLIQVLIRRCYPQITAVRYQIHNGPVGIIYAQFCVGLSIKINSTGFLSKFADFMARPNTLDARQKAALLPDLQPQIALRSQLMIKQGLT